VRSAHRRSTVLRTGGEEGAGRDQDRALAGGPRSRSTGVRWFVKYCLYGRGTLPFTSLSRDSPLAAKLEAEQLLMDFAIWLAICRPSGRPISAKSISKYLGQVRLWHLEEYRTDIIGQRSDGVLLQEVREQPTLRPRAAVWGRR
jgi:hypothetical protein